MSIIYPSSETATTVNRAVKNVMGTTTTTDGAVDDGLIITENLQPVVECTPGMDYKITDKTITGTPPLSFHAIAQHLFDWSIDGNTDSGDSVGNRTENMFNKNDVTENVRLDADGNFIESTNCNTSDYIEVNASSAVTQAYIFSFENCIAEYDENYGFITRYITGNGNLITSATTKYIRMTIQKARMDTAMLYYGNSTIPYEPYGYDVPIVVNTTDTYHCYITDVLRKSSGETPVYDTMNSDGTITRRVDTDGTPLEEPTTETYTAPDITVNWGWNTVDVDTTVAPSNIIINYKDD